MKYIVACSFLLFLGAGCATIQTVPSVSTEPLYGQETTDALMNEPIPPSPAPNEAVPNVSTSTILMTYDTLSGQKDLASQYNTAILHTTMGDITIRFFADASPKTVNNFLNLAQAGEYDGTKFHRVIKDFMIQGGDPLSKYESKQAMWGTGGPEYRFEDEFNDEPLVRGSLAMANAGPGTNGSQFFIVTAPETPWLDGKHTNFGYVVEGMDVVEKIENVQTVAGDRPVESVVIKSIELLT